MKRSIATMSALGLLLTLTLGEERALAGKVIITDDVKGDVADDAHEPSIELPASRQTKTGMVGGTVDKTAFREVQEIYVAHTNTKDCGEIRILAQRLTKYFDNRKLVPKSARDSVLHPAKKENPMIADLAKDRQMRIYHVKEDCFQGTPAGSIAKDQTVGGVQAERSAADTRNTAVRPPPRTKP